MKKTYILSIVAFMLLAVSYVNAQGPFYPTIDTYIDQTQTTTVNNTTNPTKIEVRKASSSNERTTFIEFSIGSSNTIVVKAELNLWLYETANAANSEGISVYEVTTGSFSNATTWANIGAYTLGTALSTNTITTTGATSQPNTTANGWYKFDITTLYNRVAGEAGTDKKIRLCLKALNANLVLRFSSSETNLGAQYKPYLSTSTTVVSVTGVTVSPGTTNVGIGAKTNLTATVAPTNATNQTVAWTSSNNSVATVSATGEVTGVSVGDATITATTQDGNFTSTSSITVIYIPVTGVTVSPSSTTVVAGAYIPLTATIAPTNATNKTVTWSSSNSAIARVSNTGVVTGMSAGSATITATTQDGSFTSTSAVTVSAPAANYALNPDFELNTAPSANATNWFKWTGSANNYIINSSVVTGNSILGDAVGGTPHNGTNYLSIAPTATWPTTYDVLNKQDLTGLPNGTYTLKAWFRGNGGSGYFNNGGTYSNFAFPMNQWTQKVINNINVTNGTTTINIQYNSTGGYELDIDDIQLTLNQMVLVTGINAVSPASKTLSLNETTTLTTTTIPGNASNNVINWSSSNPSIATVSAAGLVTAVSAGSATITATTSEGGFTSTSAITVLNNYVKNPNFEGNGAPATSATSWSEWSATAAYTDNSNVIAGNVGLGDVVGGTPHSGTYYVEVAPSGANPNAYGVLNFQSIANIPAGTYTLTGWFRGNGGSGYFNVGAAYNNFNFANLSQWTQLTINDVVISTGSIQINIDYTATTGQKLDIDDIVLVPKSGGTTAIPLVGKNSDISIYPTVIGNNVLNISNSVKGNYEVMISNINGQTMYTNKLNSGNVSINTSFLKTGMYLVRVNNGIENCVQKVIIP